MARRPRVNVAPSAQNYAADNERIIEISTGEHSGLISVKSLDDGSLVIDLYRLDAGVRVNVERQTYVARGDQTQPNS